MKGLQHQFLQGLSIAAGTDTKLKSPSLLTPFTQIIKSWLSSLPPIPLRCPYVIADNGEDRKGNGNCPMSHNCWTANPAYHADLTVSSPHGPTDRGTEHYCHFSQITLLCGWQLCLITFSGAGTLITFVPLYWQSPTFLWNNHMSIKWWQLSTPKSHMSQQKLLCHWTETDSILLKGCWPQLPNSPNTGL